MTLQWAGGLILLGGLSTLNSGPLVEVPTREMALGWVQGIARPWCQTTAGNASITNEFRISLGKRKSPANGGNCRKLLGPTVGKRPEEQLPGRLPLYHFPLGPLIPKISGVSPD